MQKVNVALLKAELSSYLARVKAGEEILITSHGEEVARLVPQNNLKVEPIQWKKLLKTHKPIKGLKKMTPSDEIVRQIRDEE